MDYEKFVCKQKVIFEKNFARVTQAFSQWNDFNRVGVEFFLSLHDLLDRNFENYFSAIITSESFAKQGKDTPANFLQFYVGKKKNTLLSSKASHTQSKQDNDFNMVSENDTAILFVQISTGEVVALVYTCFLEVVNLKDHFSIYKVFKSPRKIKERHLTQIIKFYFQFLQRHSLYEKSSFWNKIRRTIAKIITIKGEFVYGKRLLKGVLDTILFLIQEAPMLSQLSDSELQNFRNEKNTTKGSQER